MNPNKGNLLQLNALHAGGLATIGVVSNIVLLESTESTNTAAHERALAKPGTLIVTNHQTGGKGRQGRSWESPPGAGLTFSLVLKPASPLADWSVYPLVVGYCTMVGIRQILREHGCSADVSLKWPNDIQVEGKKVAGILCEVLNSQADAPMLVAGIGINVDWRGLPMPVEFADRSQSLAECCQSSIDPVQLLYAVVSALDTHLASDALANRDEIVAMVTASCSTIGNDVVAHGTPDVSGKAVRIAPDGQLVIEQSDGSEIMVSAADVEHLR